MLRVETNSLLHINKNENLAARQIPKHEDQKVWSQDIDDEVLWTRHNFMTSVISGFYWLIASTLDSQEEMTFLIA